MPDMTALRYLRARQYDVDRALGMMVAALQFRLDMNVNELLEKGEEGMKDVPGFLNQFRRGISYIEGNTDKNELPIYFIHVARHFTNAQKIETLKHTEELETLRDSLKGLSLFSAFIFTLGTLLDYSGLDWLVEAPFVLRMRPIALFSLTAVAAGRYGRWIFKHAVTAATHFRLNMHSLISVSTIVGLSLTLTNILRSNPKHDAVYYDTIVGILLIITVGRYMDLLSRRRAADTFTGLYSLLDQTSTVKLSKLGVSGHR